MLQYKTHRLYQVIPQNHIITYNNEYFSCAIDIRQKEEMGHATAILEAIRKVKSHHHTC